MTEPRLRLRWWEAGVVVVAVAFACSPDPPEVVGRWKNGTDQLMIINKDLKGLLYQERACVPPLAIFVHRDPYDGYSIRFVENQSVFFPLAQAELFEPSEFFCASKDSVAMCRFCRINGNGMSCGRTDQKITGKGATVTHDCDWERVTTSTTSTTTPSGDAGVRCPPQTDAATGCMGAVVIIDAGTSTRTRDAGVTD